MKALITGNGTGCYYLDPENALFYSSQYPEGVELQEVPEVEIGKALEMRIRHSDSGLELNIKIPEVTQAMEVSRETLLQKGIFTLRLAR